MVNINELTPYFLLFIMLNHLLYFRIFIKEKRMLVLFHDGTLRRLTSKYVCLMRLFYQLEYLVAYLPVFNALSRWSANTSQTNTSQTKQQQIEVRFPSQIQSDETDIVYPPLSQSEGISFPILSFSNVLRYLIHSFIHPFIHSLIHSIIHSIIHYSFIHSLIHSLKYEI